jgi:hypothetical protein
MIKKIFIAALLAGAFSLGTVSCSFAPPPPVLIQPNDGSVLLANYPFVWSSVPDAVYYLFEISSDPGFGTIIFDIDLVDTAYDISSSSALDVMEPGYIYYWHVRSGSETDWGKASEYRTFSVITGGKD